MKCLCPLLFKQLADGKGQQHDLIEVDKDESELFNFVKKSALPPELLSFGSQ
jgi:hypothetical protein